MKVTFEEHRPVVRVNELGCNSRSLHLVQKISDFLEISQMCPIRIERSLLRCSLRQPVNNEFGCTTRVYLEVKISCLWVLPSLYYRVSHRLSKQNKTY